VLDFLDMTVRAMRAVDFVAKSEWIVGSRARWSAEPAFTESFGLRRDAGKGLKA